MPQHYHIFPDLVFLVLSAGALLFLAARARRLRIFRGLWGGAILAAAAGLAIANIVLGYFLLSIRISRHFNADFATWTQAFALLVGMCAIGAACLLPLLGRIPFRPERREAFHAAGTLLLASPAAVVAFGIIHRNDFRVSQVDIPIPGLPRDLAGLRMVQVSDIHLSPFLSERELERVIDLANETKADLALVTGDLITRPGDPLDACIRQIARLRAPAGVFGCMGNHESYAGVEEYVAREAARRGIPFLRQQRTALRFGNSTLNLAGVDYQPAHSNYLVGAGRLIVPGQLNVLLSHNPDVFPVAARQGWDLTISGHTHGGQIDVEILHAELNVARYFTPFVRGLYRRGKAGVYVSRGIGTVGVPIRLGAPPEVSLIRLCAI